MPRKLGNATGPYSPRQAIIPISASIAYIPLTRGMFALVNREDAEALQAMNWATMKDKGSFYVGTHIPKDGKHPVVRMQRFLIGGMVDHINRNPMDNRRCNLRPVTFAQNAMNRKVQSRAASGLKGVTLAYGGKFKASIRVNKRLIHLGTFSTKEEAHAAYCSSATKHFGEYASF
jgi:hypothetical protein